MSIAKMDILLKLILAKKNQYVRERICGDIEMSKNYSAYMIAKYGFNRVQNTEEGFRLLYVLNKVCPMLKNSTPTPVFVMDTDREAAKAEYLKMVQAREEENAELSQSGVEYAKEEWDYLLMRLKSIGLIPQTAD